MKDRPEGEKSHDPAGMDRPAFGNRESSAIEAADSSQGDSLSTVPRLVGMLERQQAALFVAEEARRAAELKLVGLQDRVAQARETTRRVEAELQELKAEVATQRARTNEGPEPPSASMPASSATGEDGRRAVEPGGDHVDGSWQLTREEDSGTETMMSPGPGSAAEEGRDEDVATVVEEEPPLPPGWRYATEEAPPKKRWGLRGKED